MTDAELVKIDGAVMAYRHAMEMQNPRAVYAQLLNLERNCPTWLAGLLQESKAFRQMGPTAETAIALDVQSGELRPKKLVYVCSPLHGDIKRNTAAAQHYCELVIRVGYIPIAPHVMFSGILNDDDQEQRNIGIGIGLDLIRFCNELWVFGPHITAGMHGEIDRANALKIPTKRMDEYEIR